LDKKEVFAGRSYYLDLFSNLLFLVVVVSSSRIYGGVGTVGVNSTHLFLIGSAIWMQSSLINSYSTFNAGADTISLNTLSS
jgi:hypothetical protein